MSATMVSEAVALESHKGALYIAAVTLIVRDLDRVARFYRDVIGLSVVAESNNIVTLGNDGVALLSLLGDPDAEAPEAGAPGLFHTAFVLPSREHLGQWLATALANRWEIEGASDHLVSEAIYLSDPEGNGIEIYRDRPRNEWRDVNGALQMANAALDGQGLLSLAAREQGKAFVMPAGARIGHVHLCVNDLGKASCVVNGKLGMEEMCRYPGAVFFGADGYHHHIATNIWRTKGTAVRAVGQLGLAEVALAVTDRAKADMLMKSLDGRVRFTSLDGLNFAVSDLA